MFRSNRITNKRGPDEFCHFPRAFRIILGARSCVCVCAQRLCGYIIVVYLHDVIILYRWLLRRRHVFRTYHVFFNYQCDSNSHCARRRIFVALNGTYTDDHIDNDNNNLQIHTFYCSHLFRHTINDIYVRDRSSTHYYYYHWYNYCIGSIITRYYCTQYIILYVNCIGSII